jgi:rRNA biogenesis protein RRP5
LFISTHQGFIPRTQLPRNVAFLSSLKSTYSVDQSLYARVLYVHASSKRIGLSCRPDVMANALVATPTIEVGQVVDECPIILMTPHLGAYVSLPNNSIGFVNQHALEDRELISKKGDKAKKYKQTNFDLFKVGTTHQARCTNYHTFDNVALLSFQASVLNQPFLRASEVAVGEIVEGVILQVLPQGLVVGLSSHISAFCSSMHMSDSVHKKVASLFKVGTSYKFRVLSNVNEDGRSSIYLTHKKSLVESTLPIITSYDVPAGTASHGTIFKPHANGCLVKFYNNVTGYVPTHALSLVDNKVDIDKNFPPGTTVRVHVVHSDPAKKRLGLSVKPVTSTTIAPTAEQVDGIDAGSLISVKVVETTQNGKH